MTHTCHNPNCRKPLPAPIVAHKSAWYALPQALRDAIWANYRDGQEIDKRPSQKYLEALEACVAWWREHETLCSERKPKPTPQCFWPSNYNLRDEAK